MNKFYIQIFFFLLSVSVYLNNKTLATAPDIGMAKKIKIKKRWDTPKEIYIKNKDLLCANPNEITNAVKLMNEAATHLEHHATCKDGYKPWRWNSQLNNVLYKKKHGDTVVQKMNLNYYHVHTYDKITNILWDPALANKFNRGSVKTAKFDISEDKTIIVMASANINDGYNSKKKYKNTIIENANVFKTQINSEHYIRNGILKKTFVNIAGYILERTRAYVNITYLESIDGHTSNYRELINVRNLNNFFILIKNGLYKFLES
ncbi:fam-a protein [Plasmodium vinckei brucechwatti]|uniref:Fam-a protein n=1 Tax=Plasmodium vinckei brucechwatti TaxID=119398 RepID=A0A6V7SK86_PLAVN|nr:fam-a protein [Plasmodium vinckei brucechwatti]